MYQLLGKKKKNQKGFTLIELIVVIAILAILAAILIPRFTGFQDKAKATQALVYAKQVATAIDGLIIEEQTLAVASNAGNVRSLSGVTTSQAAISITSAVAPSGADYGDGYFTVTVTGTGSTTYVAGRNAASGGKVVMNP